MINIINRSSVLAFTLILALGGNFTSAQAQSMSRNSMPSMGMPFSSSMLNSSRMGMFPPQMAGGFGYPMSMGAGYGMSYRGMMGYSPYGMGQYGGQGYYGQGSYGQGSYGQDFGGGYGQVYSQPSHQAESKSSAEDRSLGRVLTASGVPNDDGRIRWPMGLSILAGTRPDELREQIGALFYLAAAETATGAVNKNVTKQLTKRIEEFRRLLLKDRNERFLMSSRTYDEAERFLEKLSDAKEVLEPGLGNSTSEAELRPGSASPSSGQGKSAEVSLRDDSLQPKTLTVAAGTTVRWTNEGKHRHTVTFDQQQWDSGPINPGVSYSHKFDRPGTYAYHCELHPQQMRGIIEVK
jgi:plastocyanin